jgi:membrane-associated protease RseP (regulator of RpoE activity)
VRSASDRPPASRRRAAIRRSAASLLLLLLGATAATAGPGSPRPPDALELAAHVGVLAAPDMEGRGAGTPGGERAAQYIADQLEAAGLRPGGDSGTFFQPFVIGASVRPSPRSVIERIGDPPVTLVAGRDWMPHGGSRAGEVIGEVVLVGHGVVAHDGSHDDWAAVDARGKVAVALDGTPADRPDLRQTRLEKLIAARRRGAVALLIAAASLPPAAATASPVDIVSGTVTGTAAAALAPGSRVLIRVEMRREDRHAFNVVGVLPGRDPGRAAEAIVIGAHYDHLGRVGGAVHPGADDNASGTAMVLGLARSFAAAGGAARALVFALFSGEEMGLIGSGHYVTSPVVPLDRTVAMLNFDMVGRLGDRRLRVGGVASGGGLHAVAAEAGRGLPLAVDLEGSPFSPSDHHRFYSAGVPVLFFHTGTHADYHRPTDGPDRIDAAGMAQVAGLAVRIVEQLAAEARPLYARVPPPAPSPGGRAEPAVGAFLGVSPDLDEAADGLRLRSVVEGSAAARAGMRDGDIVVRVAGVPIESFDDLRSLIRARRPGDTVSVLYLRDGQDHSTTATLGAWPTAP